MKDYKAPEVRDLGRVHQMTANDGVPMFVDVPQGTPVGNGLIVGSTPFPTPTPSMS